ncbi:MAG: carboxymuconolactone decarboxylase family protein [Nitrospiraceae bacterium]|nr:carboxymuconolactone decarboxylase family protein [Nitrospiraceae bacterium]
MRLDNKTSELIAIGASVTANCQPCLQYHVNKAYEFGADEEEVAAAIEIGKTVRKGASAKMDKFAASLNTATASNAGAPVEGCGCS